MEQIIDAPSVHQVGANQSCEDERTCNRFLSALSEAQQNQVFQIYYQLTPVIRERILAGRRAHEELEELAIAVGLDSDRGRELFAAEAQALAEVADIRLHAMRGVYELLTAEQRAQALHLPIRYE